jgi:spore germination cell wall hydrolase CwlJ-like protein
MKIKKLFSAAVLLGGLAAGLFALPEARAAGREVPPEALRCLALAVYFEARGESVEGQAAVAHVVVNRAREAGFPEGVCQVVQQGGEQRPCQFGWYCDGRSDRPRAGRLWETSLDVAQEVLAGRLEDPTDGALYFVRRRAKKPSWTHRLTRVAHIGGHVFYR